MTFEDLPPYPEAREITLKDKSDFNEVFQTLQPQISEYTFTNLYTWRRNKCVLISGVDEIPLILQESGGVRYMMPPLSKISLKDFIKIVGGRGEILPFFGILKDQTDEVAEMGFTVTIDRDNWDYVYLVEDLIKLRGSNYRVKRQNINQCLSQHTCEYVEITESLLDDCLQFYERWCKYRKCEDDQGLEAEGDAIRETLTHFNELHLFGAAIYVDGSFEAFTIGEQLNNETSIIHFEKATPMIRGLYQLINNWFCKNRLKDFTYVNREQDLGISGLRRAKMEYYPHHFVEKYTVTPT